MRRFVTWPPTSFSDKNVIVLSAQRSRADLTVLWGRRLILYREVSFSEDVVLGRIGEVLDLPRSAAELLLLEYGLSRIPGASADEKARQDASPLGEILRPCLYDLAEQVSRALVYTESRLRGERVDALLVAGPAGRWAGIDAVLGEALPLPVEVLNPFSWMGLDATVEDPFGLEVAAGLALRGLTHVE